MCGVAYPQLTRKVSKRLAIHQGMPVRHWTGKKYAHLRTRVETSNQTPSSSWELATRPPCWVIWLTRLGFHGCSVVYTTILLICPVFTHVCHVFWRHLGAPRQKSHFARGIFLSVRIGSPHMFFMSIPIAIFSYWVMTLDSIIKTRKIIFKNHGMLWLFCTFTLLGKHTIHSGAVFWTIIIIYSWSHQVRTHHIEL